MFKFNPGIWRALRLIIILVFIIHCIACAYWGVAAEGSSCDWDEYIKDIYVQCHGKCFKVCA